MNAAIKPSAGQLIASLEEGETHTFSHRFTLDELTAERMASTFDTMRSGANAFVARAKKKTEGFYKVESGEIRTKDYAMVLCVIVTRLAADPESL